MRHFDSNEALSGRAQRRGGGSSATDAELGLEPAAQMPMTFEST
jgi:hypothetical protein